MDQQTSLTPALTESIANDLAALPGRTTVAVDGVDGAGKTVFADALAERIEGLERPVIRAGSMGSHAIGLAPTGCSYLDRLTRIREAPIGARSCRSTLSGLPALLEIKYSLG